MLYLHVATFLSVVHCSKHVIRPATVFSATKHFIKKISYPSICPVRDLTTSNSTVLHIKSTMVNKSEYILPNNTDIVPLDCHDAFNALNEQEKKYAHYLSKASWYGSLICLHQTSPESPGIFLLFHRMFTKQSVASFVKKIQESGIAEDEVRAFFIYAGGFFANMGNYKSFGDTKIIPNMSQDSFEKIVSLSEAYGDDDFKTLLKSVIISIFALDPPHVLQIGLKEKGISTYFSRNCDMDDAKISLDFMDSKGLSPYNTRLFKEVNGDETTYTIKLASSELLDTASDASDIAKFLGTHNHSVDGKQYTFKVGRGDYSPLMKMLADNLKLAKEFASNDNEKNMIDQYVLSFSEGSLEAHKNGSRFWIKNKGPIVETYIGFIESYRDPSGVRGEFEGFVAMVNKNQSAKFTALVESAEKFISYLPWDSSLEKDTFLRPDFTSLDILTFGSTGVPAGINIPNYDDIRQSEGFKNVHLGNVLRSAYKDSKVTFLKEDDVILYSKLKGPSFEVQVGLHELLGHGSGKLLFKHADGTYNYNHSTTLNPLTKEQINKWYQDSESYTGKFGDIASSYEECRAECVGIYLCLHHDILKIFGHEGSAADDLIYINWLNMVRAGLLGLEFYTPENKTWRQAHMQARYIILRVLLEAGEDFVQLKQITGEDDQPDLLLTLDRSKINTVGKKAIGDFLQKLQVYKSMGDYSSAKEMYSHYSSVSDEQEPHFLSFRQIVMARKQPRKLLVQHNTDIVDGVVTIKDYEGSAQSLVESNIDRFVGEDIYNAVYGIWIKDAPYFV